MAKRLNSVARVQVTVEVTAGPWGKDCTAEQIYKQASTESVEKVQRLVEGRARIVGEPKVTMVLVEEDV